MHTSLGLKTKNFIEENSLIFDKNFYLNFIF